MGINACLNKLLWWAINCGILFMGYELFRNLALGKRIRKKGTREEFGRLLLEPGADLVMCDEGHVMRNSKSSLFIVINQV